MNLIKDFSYKQSNFPNLNKLALRTIPKEFFPKILLDKYWKLKKYDLLWIEVMYLGLKVLCADWPNAYKQDTMLEMKKISKETDHLLGQLEFNFEFTLRILLTIRVAQATDPCWQKI